MTKTNAKDEKSNTVSSEIDYYDQSDDQEYCSAYENEGYRFVIMAKYFHIMIKKQSFFII